MIRGLYTAATSMIMQMEKMDVIANNMSNADTTGYKKDTLVQTAFHEELTKRIDMLGGDKIGGMSNGVATSNIRTDFKQGNLKNTGGPLDLALDDAGFFCVNVNTKDGNSKEMYTRNGSFTLDENGNLIDSNKNFVSHIRILL